MGPCKKKTSSPSDKSNLHSFLGRAVSKPRTVTKTLTENLVPEFKNRLKQPLNISAPLCTSDQGWDYVLLGPHGIQEINESSNIEVPSSLTLTQEDYLYGSLCGAKRTTTTTKRKRFAGSSSRRALGMRHSKKYEKTVIASVTTSPLLSSKSPQLELTQEQLCESIAVSAKRFFGVENLMDFQIASIEAIFRKKDVFVLMSTGAGKSLCYQLPPVMPEACGRFVLVISPLIALMEDQVLSLRQKKIPSMSFSGASNQAWASVKKGDYKLVYCTPEFIALHLEKIVRQFSNKILFIAIDECHCVSEWGHHFRPSYRGLARLRTHLGHIPLMCLTATATQEVRLDIIRIFKLQPVSTLHLKGSTNRHQPLAWATVPHKHSIFSYIRQNIFYRVLQRKGSIFEDFKHLLALSPENPSRKPIDNSAIGPYSSTLIYVSTKQDAEAVAKILKSMGVWVAPYHAGMSTSERSRIHHDFLADNLQVVCATVAFGMGIDKPDIRRIVHLCLPSSLESYAQQSGRAGRDRIASEALILWSPKDITKTRHILLQPPESGHLSDHYRHHLLKLFDSVLNFVENVKQCRRELLLNYFGDTVPDGVVERVTTPGICSRVALDPSTIVTRCDLCDICCQPPSVKLKYATSLDLTCEARILLECILTCKERTGSILPCKVASGSKSREILNRQLNKVPVFGRGASIPFTWWKNLMSYLRTKGYVEEKLVQGVSRSKRQNHYMAVKLTPLGRHFLKSQECFVVQDPPCYLMIKKTRTPQTPQSASCKVSPSPSSESVQNHESQLRQELLNLRLQEAREKQCAPYMILPMISIEYMVHLRPGNIDQLLLSIPHAASFCSMGFLQKLVNIITQWASRYGYPLNLEANKAFIPPQFRNEAVKEEVIPDLEDCITLSPNHEEVFSKSPSYLNSYITPNISSVDISESELHATHDSSTVYELSQSDIAEFDNFLPNKINVSP